MTDAKRNRQRAAREARRAAEAAAARRALARRRARAIGLGLAVLAAVVAFSVTRGGDEGADVASGPTTTAPGADAGSAAGKPCIPVADPLPAGAPAVPVRLGAPPTELVKEDLTAGTGVTVNPGASVTVNYIGVSCSTGTIFDASYGRQPATFSLGGVIKGWQEGIPGMNVGGRRLLGIPPAQGYGPSGQPPTIAPDETLWFVVEVLGVG